MAEEPGQFVWPPPLCALTPHPLSQPEDCAVLTHLTPVGTGQGSGFRQADGAFLGIKQPGSGPGEQRKVSWGC